MLENRMDEFLVVCTNKGLARKTLQSYEQTLRMFQQYAASVNLEQEKKIEHRHIEEYIAHLSTRGKYTAVVNPASRRSNHPENRRDNGEPISKTSINNILRNLNVFFNFLCEERMIKENPIRKTDFVKNPRQPQAYMSDNDFTKLLNGLDTFTFAEVRDRVIIELLLDTGMRIGECLLVRDQNINLEVNTILLPAENTKGKRDRYVYFGKRMAKELRRWLQFRDRYQESEYLFCTNQGKPLQISNFEANLRKYCKRCRITPIHPHILRNNFAKRFLMNGGDIYTLSRILGHSSVTVTEKAYLDLTQDDLRKKYAEFSPLNAIKLYA